MTLGRQAPSPGPFRPESPAHPSVIPQLDRSNDQPRGRQHRRVLRVCVPSSAHTLPGRQRAAFAVSLPARRSAGQGGADGWPLPVSVAMKRHESDYRGVLQGYSRPLRERWPLRWIDGGQYGMGLEGHPALYRYWDVTDCVAFVISDRRTGP